MTARGGDFKRSLQDGTTHFGLFLNLPTLATAEALARSDFGFFVIDVEHGPTSVPHVHAQLTALATSSASTVVRLSSCDAVAVKYYLDLGADALMVPSVENAATAREAARMMRYAPEGYRGVGGTMRATDYGRDLAGYYARANAEACLFVQIETVAGMRNLDEICAVPEVDVVFFGPNDYAAQLGLLGQPAHPEVLAAIDAGVTRARDLGKATGILIGEALVERYLALGTQIVAVGSEISLMARAADALAKRCEEKRTVRA
jgi:2-keto-3-deoxy-L-rhamnonate aldolase RhmA